MRAWSLAAGTHADGRNLVLWTWAAGLVEIFEGTAIAPGDCVPRRSFAADRRLRRPAPPFDALRTIWAYSSSKKFSASAGAQLIMKIEEAFLVGAPIERVWEFAMNPAEMAPCVPGCGDVEVLGGGKYRASVKVAMGPVRTSFNVSVELVKTEAPAYASMVTRGEEGGKASMLTADSELHLKMVGPNETEVRYKSEVSIVGRFGRFGFGMMKKKARDLGEQFAGNMRERLETA